MRILAEIDRQSNVPHYGKIARREAVRGVIPRGQELLMVHSTFDGGYKFPGGGIEQDEPHETALYREIGEENGAELLSILQEYGKTIEYDFPVEKNYDVFCMTSYCYICEINPNLGDQHLDAYEAELGFAPSWVNIDVAIKNNYSILNSSDRKTQWWVRRETQVLELIKKELAQA
ncbi:MAG: NUDIX family hydrolase [Chloroflexi bacterium]|nr:MAG: NUDIX family hydrolase [Chloroflexota bacterium]